MSNEILDPLCWLSTMAVNCKYSYIMSTNLQHMWNVKEDFVFVFDVTTRRRN